jgi:hypothetical protein
VDQLTVAANTLAWAARAGNRPLLEAMPQPLEFEGYTYVLGDDFSEEQMDTWHLLEIELKAGGSMVVKLGP